MKLTLFEKAVLEKAYENGLRFFIRVNEKDILFVERNPKDTVQHFRYFCRKIDNVHGIEVYPFGTTSLTAPNEDTEVYYDFELVEK